MDKRIIKTKEKLQKTLVEILAKTDLTDISVTELCNKAGVNRSTFYVYYDNVSDCFEEIEDFIIEELKSAFYQEPERTQGSYLRVYFRLARKYQPIFKAIHRAGIHNSMIHKMVDINNELLHEQLFIPFGNERLEYSFIFSGFYGIVEAWINNGCRESDEEMVEILKKLIIPL